MLPEEYLEVERVAGRIVEVDPVQVYPEDVNNIFGVNPSGSGQQMAPHNRSTDRSVNDGISRELSSMHYVSVDTAVELAVMAKVDIQHSYRNVPVHPEDQHLLGVRWKGMDKALPFGLRSAPKLFSALADALKWIIRATGVDWCIHYMMISLQLALQTQGSASPISTRSRKSAFPWAFH